MSRQTLMGFPSYPAMMSMLVVHKMDRVRSMTEAAEQARLLQLGAANDESR